MQEASYKNRKGNFGDGIHVCHVVSLESQTHILKFGILSLLEKGNIGLIVIDSIATNFRANDTDSAGIDIAHRATEIFEIMTHLKHVASMYNVAILCINEMSANFNHGTMIGNSVMDRNFHYTKPPESWDASNTPALGHSFAVCVNNRYQFQRKNFASSCVRSMHVLFSTVGPLSSCGFVITDAGLTSAEGEEDSALVDSGLEKECDMN
jgi:RecA/RadA recombinase